MLINIALQVKKMIPQGRLGKASEVAGMVAFLALDREYFAQNCPLILFMRLTLELYVKAFTLNFIYKQLHQVVC
jgi:hypothetical protein